MGSARGRAGLILVAALALHGCGSGDACRSDVRHGVIPDWARAGFSEAEPRAPYVVGEEERIAGIVFGDPLTAPPRPRRQNKILWVPREPTQATRLHITARQGDETVTRDVDLGPSTVDLPDGCWELTLAWGDREDEITLTFR